LVFLWHEDEKKSVKELETIESRDAHVEEDAIEHRHGDVFEDWSQEHTETHSEEDGDVCHSLLSNPKKLRLFPWSGGAGLSGETLDVVEGKDSGCDKPGDAEDGADNDEKRDNEEIQVVATAFIELELLPVDDDRRDLLIHEDENCPQECREEGKDRGVHRVSIEGRDEPVSSFPGGSKFTWDVELWRIDCHHHVKPGHADDGNNNRKVGDVVPDYGGEEEGRLELFEMMRNKESSDEK